MFIVVDAGRGRKERRKERKSRRDRKIIAVRANTRNDKGGGVISKTSSTFSVSAEICVSRNFFYGLYEQG